MFKKTLLMIRILTLSAVCSFPGQAIASGKNTPPTSTPSVSASSKSQEGKCKPSEARLDGDATLSDRAGRYRLTLVVDSGGTSADSSSTVQRAVSGLLTLVAQVHDPGDSDSSNDPSTPLYGFTDIDPVSVGAHRVGDPGSEDPAAPGVLVLERSEYGRRIITLRLGSDANRKDLVRYDGEYTVLSVNSIDEDGFAGSWRSGGGLGFTVTTGCFCAWSVP